MGLLLLATVLRVGPLTVALPYMGYVDEGYVLHPAAHMIAENTADPGHFNYPSLLMNVTAISAAAYSVAGGDDIETGAETTNHSPYYDVVEPEQLLVIGRLLVLAFSVGTVVVTMLLASRLISRRAGLLAGLLAAVTPALVSRSSIVIVDMPATFFVMASLLFTTCFSSPTRARTATLLAGAMAGLAFTSKYSEGAVILSVLVMVASDPATSRRSKVRRAAAACGAWMAAAIISMPALVLHATRAYSGLRNTANAYSGKVGSETYWSALVDGHEVGWLLVLLAVPGLVILLRTPRSRRLAVAWIVFAVPFAGSFLIYDFQPFRNYLPLVPFLIISAVAAVESLVTTAGRRFARGRQARVVISVATTVAVAVALFFSGVKPYLDARSKVVDNRALAVEWLEREVRAGDTVLVAEELAFLPGELARVPAEVVVTPMAGRGPTVDPSLYTYVVTGRFKPAAAGRGSGASDEPAVQFSGSPTIVDPKNWRSNRELIEIYRNH